MQNLQIGKSLRDTVLMVLLETISSWMPILLQGKHSLVFLQVSAVASIVAIPNSQEGFSIKWSQVFRT
jgi:hypothetical protein